MYVSHIFFTCTSHVTHMHITCDTHAHVHTPHQLSKYDMEQVIEKEMSGHLKEGMVAIGE